MAERIWGTAGHTASVHTERDATLLAQPMGWSFLQEVGFPNLTHLRKALIIDGQAGKAGKAGRTTCRNRFSLSTLRTPRVMGLGGKRPYPPRHLAGPCTLYSSYANMDCGRFTC